MSDEAKPVTWDDVLAMYDKMSAPPPPKRYIIDRGMWVVMLAGASEGERATLEKLREVEVIIVSNLLPNGVTAVEFDPTLIIEK